MTNSTPTLELDPIAADRRILIRYILEDNAKRGVTLELPVGTDSLDQATWLLDAIDPKKLIQALATSSRIDLTSVCEAENARPGVRRISVTSTASERDLMSSLSLQGMSGLDAGTPLSPSLTPSTRLPRLEISHASSTLDDQSLADVAFEFFIGCCGAVASPELVQSMRGQLEISERRGKDLVKLLGQIDGSANSSSASSASVALSPLSMLDIRTHLRFLQLASPNDFQNFKAYMAWRNGTAMLVRDSLVHAVTASWDATKAAKDPARTAHYLLAKMKGTFRRLECNDADEYDGAEKEEVVESIVAVYDEIVSRCCVGRAGIQVPWDLRVSIAECLLRGTFDSFDAGSLIDEADELDRLLASKVWPVLGITDDIHMALQIWAHFRNFYISKEIGLLDRAIDIVSRGRQEGGSRGPGGTSPKASCPESVKLVNNIMAGVRTECVRVLSDYHALCKSPREVSAIMRLLVAVESVAGNGQALPNMLADLIRTSVTESFERKAQELRQHAASEQDVVALLATACLELLRSECEEYSAMLRHFVPSSIGLAASALHEAYGARLLPWIVSIPRLDKHIIASISTVLSLEDQLLSEMQAFGMDAEITPWGVLGRITPALYDWTKCQLDTLEQWSERIISNESWKVSSVSGSSGGCGTSMGEILKASSDVVESLFTMGIPIPAGVVRSMVDGVDIILQKYCDSIISPLRNVDEIFPPAPPLTRYKKDIVDTAQQIEFGQRKQSTLEKSPGASSLKNITAKVGSVFTSSWMPALTTDQREHILNVPYDGLALRANSLRGVAQGMSQMQDIVIEKWESSQPQSHGGGSHGMAEKNSAEWASGMFAGVVDKALTNIEVVLHFVAMKLICGHLRDDIFSTLYRYSVEAHRLNPILLEVDTCLGQMCQTLAPDLAPQLAHHFCHTLNAAVAHVLLDGGPVRWFSLSDVATLKEDMESMAFMFYADGEGLGQEEIESIMRNTLNIVQLMDEDTGALVALVRDKATRTRRGLSEDTIIRVLCHRKDHSASKYLKSQHKIKKTLPNVVSAAVGSAGKGSRTRR
jgi:hypothetical protein